MIKGFAQLHINMWPERLNLKFAPFMSENLVSHLPTAAKEYYARQKTDTRHRHMTKLI